MADIDDELLALAGGSESESEGEETASDHHERGGSQERDGSEDINLECVREDASSLPPPTSRKITGPGIRKGKRTSSHDSDAEENEPNRSPPGTPNSLDSAPMDESDSDAEVAPRTTAVSIQPYNPDEDENKYPYEGLYKSRMEKVEIDNMVEFEREQLLAERAAEVEKTRQNRILRQLVTTQDVDEKKKKRTADAAELDDDEDDDDGDHHHPGSARRTSRQRTARPEGAKPSEMGSTTDSPRSKQEKSDRQRRRDDGYSPRRSRERSVSNDRSPRGARARRSSSVLSDPAPKAAPPADLRDLERIRLGRHRFAEVCYTPGFGEAVVGCYTRINVGPSPDTNVDQYRIGVIKEITTGRPYALEGTAGPFVTDQYVKAAHGASAREFPFISCSDRPFTEAEWNRYKITCTTDHVTIPDRESLSHKTAAITSLIDHQWTPQEIEAKIQRKKEFRRRFDPTERERLTRQIANAQEQGFTSMVANLQADLDNLGTLRLAFRTTLGTIAGRDDKAKSQQDRLAELNRENRRRNADDVRRAQLKEKARARDIEARISRGELVEGEDQSRRLKTKAKFVHDVHAPLPTGTSQGQKKVDTADPDTSLHSASQQFATVHSGLLKLQQERHKSHGMPTVHQPLVDDDIIGAIDLDIDIEI